MNLHMDQNLPLIAYQHRLLRQQHRLIIGLLIAMLYSCAPNTDHLNIDNPKIKIALKNRQNLYAQEILQTCKNTQISKADKYVDSIISVEFNFRLSDSIIFPEKPIKPASIGKILVSDTIRAIPIFGIKD